VRKRDPEKPAVGRPREVVSRVLDAYPYAVKCAGGHEPGVEALLRALDNWDGARPLEPYLAACCRGRRPPRSTVSLEDVEEPTASEKDDIEARDTISYIMGRLDAYDRVILRLRFWEGMTYAQISAIVSLNRADVSRRVERTLKFCRTILKER